MLKYYQDPNAKCPSAHRAQIMKNLEPWSGFSQIYRVRLSLTVSQSSFSMSTKILISSGMAMAGWVSFSWMATWKTWNPAVKQLSRSYWRHTNRGDCCTRWRSVILLLCCKLSASQLLCFWFSSINDWIGSLLFPGSSRRRFCRGRPSWWSWSGGWCLGVWPPRQSTPASVGVLFLRRTTEHRDRRDRRDLDLSTRECFLEITTTCASGQNTKPTLSLG